MSEAARHKLHTALEESIGEGNAGALMQMVPPYEWHEIATKTDLAALKDHMVLHFKVVDQRFEANDQQHAEFMGRIEILSTGVAGLKTDVARLDAKVDGLTDRVDALDAKVDGLTDRVDALDAKVDGLTDRVDALDAKVDALDAKVDGLTDRVDALSGTVDGLVTKIGDNDNKFNGLLSSVNSDMAQALHRHTLANTGIMIAFLSLLVTALKLS